DGEDRSERIRREGKAQHAGIHRVRLRRRVSYPTAEAGKNLRNQPENNLARRGRISRSVTALPPAQGQATVGQQPRTPRRAPNHESHVICSLCQILAQRGKKKRVVEADCLLALRCVSGSEFRSTRVTVQSSLNPFALAFAWLFSASPSRFQ